MYNHPMPWEHHHKRKFNIQPPKSHQSNTRNIFKVIVWHGFRDLSTRSLPSPPSNAKMCLRSLETMHEWPANTLIIHYHRSVRKLGWQSNARKWIQWCQGIGRTNYIQCIHTDTRHAQVLPPFSPPQLHKNALLSHALFKVDSLESVSLQQLSMLWNCRRSDTKKKSQ